MAEGQLRVTQRRSAIGTRPRQRGTLRALGLGRIGRSNTLPDRPEIRGMIATVPHLVEVIEDFSGEGKTSAATKKAPGPTKATAAQKKAAATSDKATATKDKAPAQKKATAAKKKAAATKDKATATKAKAPAQKKAPTKKSAD